MKHIIHHILAVFLVMGLSLNVHAQDSIAYFDPAQVLEVEDDTVEIARLAACQVVAGEWQYSKPYVHAQGTSIVGKLGKPIAKSKLKKNLDKAFKRLKIKNRWNSMTLSTGPFPR